jgi:hypothetical protein
MGKYEPLYKWLRATPERRISATFDQIEDILGVALPRTARKETAWWANEKGRPIQCKAWLDAGFRAENLSLSKETVDFVLV